MCDTLFAALISGRKGGFYMMKRRVLLVCITVMLLLGAVTAQAALPDLKGMTDGEIVELLAEVNREVASRGIQKTARLAKGTYIVGRDLPAGSYVYTCLATGSDWGNVTVRTEEGTGKQILWEVVGAAGEGEAPETIFMRLNEGDELKSGVNFSLTIIGGVLFQ